MNKTIFPKRACTLANKIRKDNPWGLGKELGDAIELNYDLIKQADTLDAEWFVEFCKKHHLSPSFASHKIIRNYT